MQRKVLRLFADAKAAKDHAQQVVGGELACDGTQMVVRQAQLFGQQIQRGRRALQLLMRFLQVRLGGLQGLDVVAVFNSKTRVILFSNQALAPSRRQRYDRWLA